MNDAINACGLYEEMILEHGRHPRNRRAMKEATHVAHGTNPACGDEMTVFLNIDSHNVIRDISFEGQSCAVATASASVMTETLLGKTVSQARELLHDFEMLIGGSETLPANGMGIERERLRAFTRVSEYPARIGCARVAWQGMLRAIESVKDDDR